MMLSRDYIQYFYSCAKYQSWWFALRAAAVVAFMSLASCDRTRFEKGYEYFPDMAHSLAYETYSQNPNFADGKTEQLSVKGTISREMIPYQYPASEEGRRLAGLELQNPMKDTLMDLAAGKDSYVTFCIGCHGAAGDGKGHLFTSGKFTVPPASLLSAKMLAVPPGEIYHVITVGYNVMGAHGPQIRPDERWQIVNYVQKVLQMKVNKQNPRK
jgi:mono/diheme cytochrome c family protein